MGTNYYLHKRKCPMCGKSDEVLHIGKSSAGWPFSVHVIPEANITCWRDWIAELEKGEAEIKDEYGETVTFEYLNGLVIEKRKYKNEPHVVKANQDYPDYRKADPETGDTLSVGKFS